MKRLLSILLLLIISIGSAVAYPVYYNQKSKIYHGTDCRWAHKCTVNCVKIDHTEAIRRGGRACGVCHGH
jgi:hypothetical protein